MTDWFIGDDWHHNGAFLPHAFNFLAVVRPAAARPTKEAAERFDHGTPDGYEFFLQHGAAGQRRTARTSRTTSPFWNEIMKHGDLRRVLEGAQPHGRT